MDKGLKCKFQILHKLWSVILQRQHWMSLFLPADPGWVTHTARLRMNQAGRSHTSLILHCAVYLCKQQSEMTCCLLLCWNTLQSGATNNEFMNSKSHRASRYIDSPNVSRMTKTYRNICWKCLEKLTSFKNSIQKLKLILYRFTAPRVVHVLRACLMIMAYSYIK